MSNLHNPVLVTGAGGFIGRRLVASLLEANVPVRALALPEEAVPEQWADRVEVVRGNVCERSDMDAAVAGVETVFHLAALVGAEGAYETHWNVTVEGSRNVYEAAAAAKARVIVTTSICAYGDRIARAVCAEDSERGAYQGPYGRAKQAQEDVAHEVSGTTGLDLTIVRPSNVYGIGSGPWVDGLAAAFSVGALGVIDAGDGEGAGNAGLVHVENLVHALRLIADTRDTIGTTYNVCDNLDVTWKRYMTDIAACVGVADLPVWNLEELRSAARANEDPAALLAPKEPGIWPLEALNLIGSDNRFDTTRIREELGWTPKVGYDEALAEIRAHLAVHTSP